MRDGGHATMAAMERQLSAKQTTLIIATPYISSSKIRKCAPRVQTFLQIYTLGTLHLDMYAVGTGDDDDDQRPSKFF
jgi:hypothetical protein